jgi:hypothetical protein
MLLSYSHPIVDLTSFALSVLPTSDQGELTSCLSSIKVLLVVRLGTTRYSPDTRQSGMDGPKTRTEKKGRDKDKSRDNVYTGRHVRIATAAMEQRRHASASSATTSEAAAKKPKDDKPGKK